MYLWLPDADMAVQRVAERVLAGGHDVPETTIRRRYHAGLQNFFRKYQPLATTWRAYDNSRSDRIRLIAQGRGTNVERANDPKQWTLIEGAYGHAK